MNPTTEYPTMHIEVENLVRCKAGFGKYKSVNIDEELHKRLTQTVTEKMAIWNLLFTARKTPDINVFRYNKRLSVQMIKNERNNSVHFQFANLH